MRALLFALLVLSCASVTEPKPTPELVAIPQSQGAKMSNPLPAAALSSSTPIMINRKFIEPYSGALVGELTEPNAYDLALPDPSGPGLFRVGALLVDAQTQKVIQRADPPEFTTDSGSITRHDKAGETLWTTAPKGYVGSVRPPMLASNAKQVFVAFESGILALDITTGKELWRAADFGDRLLATPTLLLSTECSVKSAKEKRWLLARQATTGKEVFRLELPYDINPEALIAVGELLLVRGDKFSMLFDQAGTNKLTIKERIISAHPHPKGLLLIGEAHITLYSDAGLPLWSRASFKDNFVAEVQALTLPDGDWLLLKNCLIADSGVELMRINPNDGALRWEKSLDGVGVDHSKYFHKVYAELRGADDLIVVSQGSYAAFVEVISLKDASSKHRHTFKE